MKKITHILFALTASFVSLVSLADVNIKADVVYGHKDGMALVYDAVSYTHLTLPTTPYV